MLPDHGFADVVQCLHFYHVEALLLTSARCSDFAHAAASRIRVFDFSGFRFDLDNTKIAIRKLGLLGPERTILNFLDEGRHCQFNSSCIAKLCYWDKRHTVSLCTRFRKRVRVVKNSPEAFEAFRYDRHVLNQICSICKDRQPY